MHPRGGAAVLHVFTEMDRIPAPAAPVASGRGHVLPLVATAGAAVPPGLRPHRRGEKKASRPRRDAGEEDREGEVTLRKDNEAETGQGRSPVWSRRRRSERRSEPC